MLKFIKNKIIRNFIELIIILFLLLFICRIWPHQPISQNLSFSKIYYDSKGKLLRITTTLDQKYRIWSQLEEINPDSIKELLLYEDKWFYYHLGFNPISLIRASLASYIGGNRQGASTITMQLARIKWKLNTKTIKGKLLQIIKAFQLELCYSKKDILEAYFNMAPYGRNIEGIGAASLIYFNKKPSQLNIAESTSLTVIPQAPNARIKADDMQTNNNLLEARNRLLIKYIQEANLDENSLALLQLPLSIRQPQQLPFLAPHFINQIEQMSNKSNQYLATEKNNIIETSLDFTLQQILEQKIKVFIQEKKKEDINNASAILVDTTDMQVKALVGSADFFDQKIFGQVNGTLAKRSPGSTLKPFIYALGFQQGLINPASILKDLPTNFGGNYSPENYDYKFKGPISVTDALISSRNIPAIELASKLKKDSFYQLLKQAEITKLKTVDNYGLSMVIGGAEISLQELAQLYAMLANYGKWKPLQFINKKTKKEKNILSEEASYMVMQILKQNIRNVDILGYKQQRLLPVYWKTGTSWGFRDNWAAGIFGHYVLVVWVGDFTSKGNNNLVSDKTATPLFFSIIDSIKNRYPNLKDNLIRIPNKLRKVDICVASGKLATKWCQVTAKTWFIPGVSSIEVDDIFRSVNIDKKTKQAVCDHNENTEIQIYEYWPSDILKNFELAGIYKNKPPQINCDKNNSINDSPVIKSPLSNMRYIIDKFSVNHNKIYLNATTNGSVKYLYWFIDNRYLTKSIGEQSVIWQPNQSATYLIKVIDEQGNSSQKKVKVEVIN